MRALTLHIPSFVLLQGRLGNNEALAREGIDTAVELALERGNLVGNNEALAREGIDTLTKPIL